MQPGRVYSLPDVWIRPAFGGKGRKMAGTLEAHSNGFRYTSPKGEQLDIMYRQDALPDFRTLCATLGFCVSTSSVPSSF